MSSPAIVASNLKTTRGIGKPSIKKTAWNKEGKNTDKVTTHSTAFGEQIVMTLKHPTDSHEKIRKRMYYFLRNNRKVFNQRLISVNLTLEQDLKNDGAYYTYRGEVSKFTNYRLKSTAQRKGQIDEFIDKSPIEIWQQQQKNDYSLQGKKLLKVEKIVINVVKD